MKDKTGFINSHGITKTGFILIEDKTGFINAHGIAKLVLFSLMIKPVLLILME